MQLRGQVQGSKPGLIASNGPLAGTVGSRVRFYPGLKPSQLSLHLFVALGQEVLVVAIGVQGLAQGEKMFQPPVPL
jgi:hypothetical protein